MKENVKLAIEWMKARERYNQLTDRERSFILNSFVEGFDVCQQLARNALSDFISEDRRIGIIINELGEKEV